MRNHHCNFSPLNFLAKKVVKKNSFPTFYAIFPIESVTIVRLYVTIGVLNILLPKHLTFIRMRTDSNAVIKRRTLKEEKKSLFFLINLIWLKYLRWYGWWGRGWWVWGSLPLHFLFTARTSARIQRQWSSARDWLIVQPDARPSHVDGLTGRRLGWSRGGENWTMYIINQQESVLSICY